MHLCCCCCWLLVGEFYGKRIDDDDDDGGNGDNNVHLIFHIWQVWIYCLYILHHCAHSHMKVPLRRRPTPHLAQLRARSNAFLTVRIINIIACHPTAMQPESKRLSSKDLQKGRLLAQHVFIGRNCALSHTWPLVIILSTMLSHMGERVMASNGTGNKIF